MPVYEYLCKKCGEDFEYLIRSGSDVPACPKCDGEKLEKKFSSFGFRSAGKDSVDTKSGSSSCSSCSSKSCTTCR